MSNVLVPVISGTPISSSDHNANLDRIENTFSDFGPYIISGLTLSAGAGLAVNVAAGGAMVGGRITIASLFAISGLTPSTTNHLYLLQNGTGSANTTGTQPANSVKLGTCTTGAGSVTAVQMTRASGRQVWTRPDSLILGGGAGHPEAGNLASWHATNTEGNQFRGQLPAGAMPTSFPAPQTLTVDDASQSSASNLLTLQHTYNAGAGAAGIGTRIQTEIETTSAGVLEAVGRLDCVATGAVAGATTGRFILATTSGGAFATRLFVDSAGVNTNGHNIIAGSGLFSGTVRGSGTAFTLGRFALTFPSDADYTLLSGEFDMPWLDVQAGVITATRNIIVPGTVGGWWIVRNNNAQSVIVKTSGGTGPTIATGKLAIVICGGANVLRVTPDT